MVVYHNAAMHIIIFLIASLRLGRRKNQENSTDRHVYRGAVLVSTRNSSGASE